MPILGVCLGHQAIGQAYGGKIVRAPTLMHGKLSTIHHEGDGVFHGINGPFQATRYHSLTIAPETMPESLKETAHADDGVIMGIRHRTDPVHGVQFHPESIASEHGHRILGNFLEIARAFNAAHGAEGGLTMADMKSFLAKAAARQPLSREEAEAAFDIIMSGEATPTQIGGFLMALRVRGETVDEIAGAVAAMRGKMTTVEAPPGAIDVVGTGGDASGTYNISTCSAFVVAGAGVPVAKHGNRALSSKSGAADVLGQLGVKIDLKPEQIADMHPRGRHRLHVRAEPPFGDEACRPVARGARHAHGVQPARPALQSGERQALHARRLRARNGSSRSPTCSPRSARRRPGWCTAALAAAAGSTRLSLTGTTYVAELKNGHVRAFQIEPIEFGVDPVAPDALLGGTPEENAKALRARARRRARRLPRRGDHECRRGADGRRQGSAHRGRARSSRAKSIDSGSGAEGARHARRRLERLSRWPTS